MRITRLPAAIAITTLLLSALGAAPVLAQSTGSAMIIGTVHRFAAGVALEADLTVTCPSGARDLLAVSASQNVGNGRIQTASSTPLPVCDGSPHPLSVYFTAPDNSLSSSAYPPWGTAPVLLRAVIFGQAPATAYKSRTPMNTVLKDSRFGVARVAAGGLGLTVSITLPCRGSIGIGAQVLQRVSADTVEVASNNRQQTCRQSGSHTFRLSFVPLGPYPWSGKPLLITLDADTCDKAGHCFNISSAIATLMSEVTS